LNPKYQRDLAMTGDDLAMIQPAIPSHEAEHRTLPLVPPKARTR
jgi:hypothetical protein